MSVLPNKCEKITCRYLTSQLFHSLSLLNVSHPVLLVTVNVYLRSFQHLLVWPHSIFVTCNKGYQALSYWLPNFLWTFLLFRMAYIFYGAFAWQLIIKGAYNEDLSLGGPWGPGGRTWAISVTLWLRRPVGSWGALKKHGQQVDRGNPPPLPSPGEATSRELCPVLAHWFKKDRELLETPVEIYKDDLGPGTSLV